MRTRAPAQAMLAAAFAGALVTLAACRRTDIPKEDMDAAESWSKATCACAEKKPASAAASCAAATKKPTFELYPGGKPKYTPETSRRYLEIVSQGEICQAKIR